MNIKKIFLSHLFEILLLLLLIGLRLIFLQIPLLKNLDLDVSIVYALLFSIISGIGTIYLKRKNKVLLRFISGLIIIQLLLFVAFILIELYVCDCLLTNGIFFFPLFSITVTIFWSSVSILVINLFDEYRLLIMLLIYFFFVAYSLIEYYFEPQLFLYNPLFIFFPGLVYNDFFELNSSILIYCISLLIGSLSIISLHLLRIKNRINQTSQNLLKIVPFLIYSLLFVISNQIGLSTDQFKLKSHFSDHLKEGGVKIYFESNNISKINQLLYLEKTKFHLDQLRQQLKYDIPYVEIYIFNSDESKKRMLGDEKADFTKPWLNQIFVTINSFDQTIKHELAHVFLGKSTDNLFKVAKDFNLTLIEGGAMALEWEWLENEPVYYAALINKFLSPLNQEKLFSTYSFITNLSSISYIYSGSIIKHLIDKYGLKKFLVFYRTNDFYQSYQNDLADEIRDFQNKLESISLTNEDSLKALVLFGEKSMFYNSCPRAFARLLREGQNLFNQRNFNEAEQIFLKLYNESNDIKYLVNLVRCKFYQKKFDDVIKLIENSQWNAQIHTINSIYLKIFYALSLAKIGDHRKAKTEIELLQKLKISSNWANYIDLIEFISLRPEYILKMTDLSYNQLLKILLKNFPEENIVLKNSIHLPEFEQLEKVIKDNSNDFWTLELCFFRYIELANFVKAQDLIHLIKTNFSDLNQVQNYHLNLMDYVLRNLMDRKL